MNMDSIKKFTPDHYEHYLEKANELIEYHRDIDSWIKSLNDKNILIWLKVLRRIRDNDDTYFQEIAIFLTLIIRLFILELDVETTLELKSTEIKKILIRFDHIIKHEYATRNDLKKPQQTKYTLLKDMKKG